MTFKFWRSTFGLVAVVSLVITIATVAIGGLVYDVTHKALKKQLNQRIDFETQMLIAIEETAGITGLADRIRRREAAGIAVGHHYILTDSMGRRVAGSMDAAVPSKLGYKKVLAFDGGTRVARALTTALPSGGKLVVAMDSEATNAIDKLILTLLGAAFGSMLLLGIAGAWTVGTITRNRLRRIDLTALAIIGGDLDQRVPIEGIDRAFDSVSMTLNRMLDRIQSLLENLRQVSSDVAHDLRTPLSRLHNSLEEVLTLTQDTAQQQAIETAVAQSREILEIFAALLLISEVESMTVQRRFKRTCLSKLVEDVVELYQPDAEASGHYLNALVEPDIDLLGDSRLLRQLLVNLLDNALLHTPPGTTIDVELAADAEAIRLTFRDDGPGVADEDLPRMFRRFSRAERSRSTAGHGLGLALVSAIAGAHQGFAVATSTKGFCATVHFPKC